jgi:alpha-tubulin suppressor-like RCC1 family protein
VRRSIDEERRWDDPRITIRGAIVLSLLVVAGCAGGDADGARPPSSEADAAHEETTTEPPTGDSAPALDSGSSDDAETGEPTLPDAGPAAPAAQLSLGHAHSCALLVDGTVRCWGSNITGELGDGSSTSRSFGYPIGFMNDVVEIDVATDGHRSCARRASGAVLCWGEVDELGPETCVLDAPPITVGCVHSPMPFASGPGVVGLGVGQKTCVRYADGTAACLATRTGAVEMLADVADLSFGGRHGCARIYDGTVMCFGDGALGQLGAPSTELCNSELGNNPCSAEPLDTRLATVAQITSGESHTCALLTDGTVKCWGANDAGQLGFGALDVCTKYAYPCAKLPGVVVGLSGVAQIAAGGLHTCARMNDGTVQCWGSDADGELGFAAKETCNGTEEEPCSTRAKPVPGLDHVVEIALGRRHSCARLDDGEVKCWGWNGFGQLGDGTKKSHSTPTTVHL